MSDGAIGPSRLLSKVYDEVDLMYGVGGEAVRDRDDWESFLDDIEEEDGVLFDLKSAHNGIPRVYPSDSPETADPHIRVYGVEPERVQELLDRYEGVQFDDVIEDGGTSAEDTSEKVLNGVINQIESDVSKRSCVMAAAETAVEEHTDQGGDQ